MNIVLKNSLKNIFGKPFRTMLVTFSIFVCSVCAMLCIDFVASFEKYVTMVFGNITAGDIIALVDDYSIKGLPDGFPESDIMEINSNHDTIYTDIEGEYAFVSTTQMNIYGIDVDEAAKMGFIDNIELGDMETYVSYKMAKEFGYKPGDEMVVHDRAGEKVILNVTGVIPKDNKNTLITGYKILVNLNTAKVISCGRGDVGVLMIDILDDTRIAEAEEMLREYYPQGTIVRLALTDDESSIIGETMAVFYLIFAITFLLVIFVTASICNRIVSERMPMIGTLRSLGMSSARTGRILLLENVLYGLLGSVPAAIFYALIKTPLYSMIFYVPDFEGNAVPMAVDPVSWVLVAGVITASVIVECLIPLKAILKAIKTPIRDIIFDNRDTEYKYSKAGLVTGLILFAGAIVAFFFRKQFTGATICLVCAVVALAFLFPWIYKLIVTGLIKLADKKEKAAWSLALTEAKTRKSTVSSGVLCVTAAAMSVIIFGISMSALDMFSGYDYSSDVIVQSSGKLKDFAFIDKLDGVTDTEAIYRSSVSIKINDEEPDPLGMYGDFFAMPENGFKYYNFFVNLPDSLEDGSIIIDERFADQHKINAGDMVTLVYDPDGVVPITREYKVQGTVKIRSFDGQTGTFLITKDEFNEIFRDTISFFLVKCDDPDTVSKIINTYAVGSSVDTETFAEYKDYVDSDKMRIVAILITVITIGLGMTFVGMVSNQLIGFDGRKKECAIMLSTSMGRGKLSGILVKEMLITSILASLSGSITGVLLCLVINAATKNSQYLYLLVRPDPLKCLLFCIILILVFTGTVLFPLKHLRKMKLSETLKYE